jgi:hypothetical protein
MAATAATPLAAQGWQRGGEAQEARDQRDSRSHDRGPDRGGNHGISGDNVRRDRMSVGHDDNKGTLRNWRERREAQAERSRNGRDWQDRRNDGNWNNPRWSDRDRSAERRGDGSRDDDRRWEGNRNWNANRNWDERRWDRSWRGDRRYGWQDYRQRNRSLYRAPRYYEPRGYGHSYRRWSPGYRIDSFYYGRNYWIADPFYYRLPPAYGYYRWVRYYDDVLLVDTRTGLIADIIYDFFWR